MNNKLASKTPSLTTLEYPSYVVKVRADACSVDFFDRFQFTGGNGIFKSFFSSKRNFWSTENYIR